MKYLRLYESKNVDSIINILDEYQKFKNNIRPYIIDKFYYLAQLSEDDEYEAMVGSTPNNKVKEENLIITNIFKFKKYIEFRLESKNDIYFISITYDELEDILIEIEGEKFNL